MRRLPGPACCRLSEGEHPPEALYELFRDWQRTQTQSSVTALQGPRQQMDVWFCRAQEPMPGGIRCALSILEVMICTLSRACPGHLCLRLTDDLHGRRLTAPYSPAPGSDRVLIEPRLRHRTPSARMIFAHTLVIAEGGSIPLHWMAA
jgi:hypothetical protein